MPETVTPTLSTCPTEPAEPRALKATPIASASTESSAAPAAAAPLADLPGDVAALYALRAVALSHYFDAQRQRDLEGARRRWPVLRAPAPRKTS